MVYANTTDILDDAIRMKGYRHTFTASKVSDHPDADWLLEIDPGGGPAGGTPAAACLLTNEQAIELANHLLANTLQEV